MRKLHASWLCLLVGLWASCAKAPFTTSVLEQYGLTPNDLGRVQFYTSEPIVLERELTRETRSREGAELRLHDDTQTEVVEVSERTPCVVLRVEGNYLLLGFSPKDLRAALWFVAQPEADGDHAYDRRFVLAALENGLEDGAQPFSPRFSKGFLISWSGQKYHVVSGRGAYLLYQLSDDERRKVEQSPPGWRLSERAPQRPALTPPPPAAAPEQQQAEQEVEVEP